MRTVGPHVASKFCEIIKLRNRLARNLGYEDFYDYKVRLPRHISMKQHCLFLCPALGIAFGVHLPCSVPSNKPVSAFIQEVGRLVTRLGCGTHCSLYRNVCYLTE